MKYVKSKPWMACYENNIDAFIPEHWAMESIEILVENMVAANLVHRDFEDEFANAGDIVNTRKPAEFKAKRKTNADDVSVQDASATNVQVPLDQHVHVSFLIRDGEETKSFKSLAEEYLRPAAIAMARATDQIVLGQVYQFLENQAGTLGGLTNANGPDYITDTRNVMNKNKAHVEDRRLILGSDAETKMLQNATFHQADRLGDDGTAMKLASLGRKFGMWTFMDQNMSAPTGTNVGLGEINNALGYPVGTTVLTVDGFGSGEVLAGDWVTINGRAYHVTAVDTAITTAITLEYGLLAAVVDNDDVLVYAHDGTVNNVGGYAAGYAKEITLATNLPQVGQLVTIGATNHRYTVIDVTGLTVLLDRPLVAAVSNGDLVHEGPQGGGFNFAFHKNALTLAIRPLALPRTGAGALAGSANFNNLTMRTVITYDGTKQGHLVTLDFLAGIKVLDTKLGAVMLS